MHRYYVHQAWRAAALSGFEKDALFGGIAMLAVAVFVTVFTGDAGGVARALGTAGVAALAVAASSRGARHHRAGAQAALPTSLARVRVRARPLRVFSVVAFVFAVVLPLAVVAAVLALVVWGWLAVAGVLLLGCAAMFATWVGETRRGEEPYSRGSAAASEVLGRLAMRADLPAPKLVVSPGRVATAWTVGGRIHVTRALLALLSEAELEAVLAHELAHLAHRDAAAMEICSAPSRVLLACARALGGWMVGLLRSGVTMVPGGTSVASVVTVVALFAAPPAFVIGWISRLSVLGMSRAREFAADAAAATLTGRPSALASALLKLDGQRAWTPRADLRRVEPYAVLCIVGAARSRLLSTHPPVAARVQRLTALEARLSRPA
jgi:heat shock protein HtpX